MSNPDKERGDLLKPHLSPVALIGVIVPRFLRADSPAGVGGRVVLARGAARPMGAARLALQT
jgi:hypothetical protein